MIDSDGFRANVGIIIANDAGRVLLGKRIGQQAWQFPQGGIAHGESPKAAMYRELHEELGLRPEHVDCLGRTGDWLRYRLPSRYVRHHSKPLCIGQKQIWFLLRLRADASSIQLNAHDKPEFDDWCWVDVDEPPQRVIHFKRGVYQRALGELKPMLDAALEAAPGESADTGRDSRPAFGSGLQN